MKMKTEIEEQDEVDFSYYKKPHKKNSGVYNPALGEKFSSTL